MTIQVFNVHEHFTQHTGQTMKLLVAGAPGSGKTRLASTFPNPIYADAEGRLLSIRDRHNARAVTIDNIAKLEGLRAGLDQRPDIRAKTFGGPVDTVVLDTVDQIARLMMDERKRAERKEAFTQPDWGIHGDRLRDILRSFRNLSDLNVIFNVHVKPEVDEESGRVEYRPAIQGSVGNEIAEYVDECFLLERRTSTDPVTGDPIPVRFLRTYANRQYSWLKDHSGALPVEFPVDLETDYERLAKTIFGAPPPDDGPSERVTEAVDWVPASEIDVTDQAERPLDPARVEQHAADMRAPEAPPKPRKKAAPRKKVADTEPAQLTVTDAPADDALVAPDAPTDDRIHPDTSVPENGTETASADDDKPKCSVCGTTDINEDYVELSDARWGVILCRTHFLERNKQR